MRADDPFLMNITHDELVDYIKENTLAVFGEEIDLDAHGAIQGVWNALAPDLMGTDAQGRTVIVEVKTDVDDDDFRRRRGAIHGSLGQILNYTWKTVKCIFNIA